MPHHQSNRPRHLASNEAQPGSGGVRIWNSFTHALPGATHSRRERSARFRPALASQPPDVAGTHPVPAEAQGTSPRETRLDTSGRRNPRVLAALAYALPIIPALVLLARERRNHFVRLHAAQSLVFFTLLAFAQAALYTALVLTGAFVTDAKTAIVLGLIFYALFALLGIVSFVVWLVLLADTMSGRRRRLPVLARLADRLDHMLTERVSPATDFRRPPRNIPAS